MSGSKMVKSEQREGLLEKHRYINVGHDDWWDFVYEDFKRDMAAVGIEVKRMYFTGFSSQGDGACFTGRLDNAERYLDHHHKDQYPMIHKLLEHSGGVYVECDHDGRYHHENCTRFWVDADTLEGMVEQPTEFHEAIVEQWQTQLDNEMEDFETDVIEQWRSYMQDLYRRLEKEYDYLVSDEAVWEAIEAHELDEEEGDSEAA